ncbi:MAG: NAD-dependent epimerase/dehydratase family protein, partial [Holosporaceae bacterium]|nr:NAD-dependent epimerase/dehydratase family protein [Holosporaceae bacterium]
FNVVEASSLGFLGDQRAIGTHLVPSIIHAALGISKAFSIFGADYPTRDGTCIRDYIPVEDLVEAHVRALDFLLQKGRGEVFNLGSEQGYTVREALTVCGRVLGKKLQLFWDLVDLETLRL